MLHLVVTLALAAGLARALLRLRGRRHIAHSLEQAILKKQLNLHEELQGDDDYSRLARATNELIAEIIRLQQLRTGQLAQLEATLGSLQEAVLIVDANNYILLANKALQAIFPSAQNILRQRLELVLRSVAFLNYVDAVRAGRAQPQHEIEFVEGNSTTWVEATGTLIPPLDDQRGPWALFVLHDITKQKRLESVRKDFVANVSHELRTPLSVIKGYIETLVDGRDMPVEDRERFLRTIQRHTERLNSLLEDLLALSRLESINPELHREPTSLSTLITGLVDDYRARPTTAGHNLNFALDPAVSELLIDPLKITQVFENLLENALKYAPRGSHIDISTRLHAHDVEICVRDNGPGIPEGDLPHIFERFYRVDKGRSREKGGTGLGLSIVKHIVQLHGGRVWCESKLGQGTAFFFSLPLHAGN
ncbi:MAG TPA: ATP-binding protein [Opitutaceae bacterium]|jgi:two-component system phosphate regulon sensor histidine kinase PhoR|nr:ATP-binding protein [Opitutaceae bacterium]